MDKIRKYSLIKKILVPVVMVALFLAPFNAGKNVEEKIKQASIEIKKNTVNAQTGSGSWYYEIYHVDTEQTEAKGYFETIDLCEADRQAFINSDEYKNNPDNYGVWPKCQGKNILTPVLITINGTENTGENLEVRVNIGSADGQTPFGEFRHVYAVLYKIPNNSIEPQPNDKHVNSKSVDVEDDVFSQNIVFTFNNLTSEQRYFVFIFLTDGSYNPNKNNRTFSDIKEFITEAPLPWKSVYFDYLENAEPQFSETGSGTEAGGDELELGCSLYPWSFNLYGCFAELFFLIFKLASLIGQLAGYFLDFFVYYSVDADSYKSGFVTQGWAAVRDIANMFFIIALLYIAIKTILGLNVSNNKKLIGYIIIFALLINFSLFFTQVIVDSSNILAKVFYNNISAVDKNGVALGEAGEKSISVGLISLFNPQKIISQEVYDEKGGTTLFIFTTILAIFVVLYAAWIFFSVALLFVGRVVMLWISMIFSPIAFASYTLPFDIPGMGHKEWWNELLKNAFLAPIFIFFLYIIVMFAGFLKEIVSYPESADFMQKLMSVIIPFAILAILLKKAKDMAVKFSGEMGKGITKLGAMAGGLALGAVTGGAAMALRGTMGKSATAALEGEKGQKLREMASEKGWKGWQARQRLKAMEARAKGSFDIRGTKAGAKFSKMTDMNLGSVAAVGLGIQQGGYQKSRADKVRKRQEWGDKLKVGKNEKLSKELKQYQESLQDLRSVTNADVAKINKDLDDATKRQAEISRMSDSDPTKAGLQDLYTKKINALRGQMSALKSGTDYNVTYANEDGTTGTAMGNYGSDPKYKSNGKNLKEVERAVIDAENAIATENAQRLKKESERLRRKRWGVAVNEEAAHNIRSGAAREEEKKR